MSSVLAAMVIVLAQATAAQAPGAAPRPKPVGTMSELMVKILYPASDAVFYISTRLPQNDADWTELQLKTLMLAESANLMMMPGRIRDQGQWMKDAQLLLDAGAAAYEAAKKKDVAALEGLNDQMYQSCVVCHQHYRPNYGKPRAESRGKPRAESRGKRQ